MTGGEMPPGPTPRRVRPPRWLDLRLVLGVLLVLGSVLLGARVRHVVATQVESVSQRVARALGPGPLTQEPEHVARVADLAVYLRQHHGERDAAALGGLLPVEPW